MQTSWDDILDSLSTHQKTADAARVLLASGQPELACMLLRDTLLRDQSFGFSDPFIAISKIPEILDYLLPERYADFFKQINRDIEQISARLSTDPTKP